VKNKEFMMMIPWITTRSFLIDLQPNWVKTSGNTDWAMGRIGVDLGTIHERLEKLVEELNQDQWEIKLIQPLEKGVTYHEHQKVVQAASRRAAETTIGAIGLGWGAQVTSGYMVIAQRTQYLTESEYIKRRDERETANDGSNEKQRRAKIMANNDRINQEIAQLQSELIYLRSNNAIQMKKLGLLRGEKYTYKNVDYNTIEEADAVKTSRIVELEERLTLLPLELKLLAE
jgi:hypothetical protein